MAGLFRNTRFQHRIAVLLVVSLMSLIFCQMTCLASSSSEETAAKPGCHKCPENKNQTSDPSQSGESLNCCCNLTFFLNQEKHLDIVERDTYTVVDLILQSTLQILSDKTPNWAIDNPQITSIPPDQLLGPGLRSHAPPVIL